MIQKKQWHISAVDPTIKLKLSQALNISEPLANVLVNRGFGAIDEAENFFHPAPQALLDPFLLKDMQQAIDRIVTAINLQEQITVYGDYDVDGITATTLMVKVLRDLGAKVEFYIPLRQVEGYGLHTAALEKLIAAGTKLLITVDCGISATATIAGFAMPLDIILTDHHLAPEKLPDVWAIINPNQPQCTYPNKNLAGVGVAYKLCQALWQTLRGEVLMNYAEFVALGTIADIVPLLGENRWLVKQGLIELNQTTNLGLKALIKECGLADKTVNAGQVGFMLAPRLNAAGRLASAGTAVELLLTPDNTLAMQLAKQLNDANEERQQIEQDILAKAEIALATVDTAAAKVLIVAGENWNSGVIGIVASRLVDKYYRPTIVISIQDGLGKGSCRSIAGFHMYDALKQCEVMLESFGGHAQAAGLNILPENIPRLQQSLAQVASKVLTDADYIPRLAIDAVVDLAAITPEFVVDLANLEPYGMGNPRPVFACMAVQLLEARSMGLDGAHLRFKVAQNNQAVTGLAWNMGAMATELDANNWIDLAFQPDINEWQGKRSVQLKAQDFRVFSPVLTAIDKLFLANESPNCYANIAMAQQFFTKVVGVTFADRQANISKLTVGERLNLVRQPTNQYDGNAIAVQCSDGRDIGFLRAAIAAQLAPIIDKDGACYAAQITDLTGSSEQNFGVNLLVYQVREKIVCQHKYMQITVGQIKQYLLGEREYHPQQLAALAALKAQNNTLVIMGTGRGKSAIFQTQAVLQAINNKQMTVILYPLRALVNDQYQNLQERLSPLGIGVYKGNGTLSTAERGDLFEALQNDQVDILLTTPEFLMAALPLLKLPWQRVGLLVVDECHHIAEVGRRLAYNNLAKLIHALGNPLVVGVTATADNRAAPLIIKDLAITTTIIDKTVRENLMIRDCRNTVDKLAYIRSIINAANKVLIFVNSRNKAVEIAADLRAAYPSLKDNIGFYHAGLSNQWRVDVENWFKSGVLKILVATSAFGEGIDLPDIRHVVQYHLPFDMTTFNQQCGRAGRDGKASFIHLLFGSDDVKFNQLILAQRAPERELIGKIYLVLKNRRDAMAQVELTNSEIAQIYADEYHGYIGEAGVGSCLKILEELRLIFREKFNGKRTINFNPSPTAKLDLRQSSSFVEGLAERQEFATFSEYVLKLTPNELLACINKPLYPSN